MHRSETLRWLGPWRYQLSGALTLLQGKAYSVRVSYVPAPSLRCHSSWTHSSLQYTSS